MSAEEDGLLSFLFYVIIVYPATAWLLKNYKTGNRGLYLAIGFLGLIAAGKTYLEFNERGPNFYATLYVSPSSTGADEIRITRSSAGAEIRKAYKRKSLELHPDKNPSPSANEEFEKVKEAYDVLTNPEQRALYNKFGPEGMNKNFVDANELLLQISIFYLTWGMLAYILTLGKSSSTARNWIYTGQIAMLVVEVSLVLQEVKLPDWFFPTVTEHEMVLLMHSLFPAFMNGCRCIGSFYYVDVDELTRKTLESLRASHTELLEQLKLIQDQLNDGGYGGKPATKKTIAEKINDLSPPEQSTVGLVGQNTNQKSSSMGFYLMIIGYIVYYTW
eukprot:CAMPEP_0172599004 /NCGR_PEP_ID=MMETSP1068-20121228/19121_1 /TAXON_ID=35684 /ORGANISM="Pseudopedinella elastica, Strain CCMP716" /LENGTH=330 /DNA_ID=CAMNT_0013399129 /DNA_START=297 /DNA_END=1286 /DNA_ORIENTATION=-